MKVIISTTPSFFLTHGGVQTLVESVMRELAGLGVEVEPERWWDENQEADIIHYFNRPTSTNVQLAQSKGFKVVMTELLDQTASRSRGQLMAQRCFTKVARTFLPAGLLWRLGWDVYRKLDAMVYAVAHEWEVAQYLFGATPGRGHVIPHGLDALALERLALPEAPGDYLVSVATIHERKNTVLLAQAAQRAGIPVLFLGKPYTEDDPYFLEFKKWVDGKTVRYAGFVSKEEKWRYLRTARGFALLSKYESGCIAVYEAAAAGLPFFLSDLPWAARVYAQARGVKFVRLGLIANIAADLRSFYTTAQRQPGTTFPLLTWRQVAKKYLDVYQSILGQS